MKSNFQIFKRQKFINKENMFSKNINDKISNEKENKIKILYDKNNISNQENINIEEINVKNSTSIWTEEYTYPYDKLSNRLKLKKNETTNWRRIPDMKGLPKYYFKLCFWVGSFFCFLLFSNLDILSWANTNKYISK